MRVALLRPAPDNARTAAKLSERGHDVTLLPLFEIVALDWTPPDPAMFDALLLTSANAARLARSGLNRLKRLPVIAVGPQTAKAAHDAGLHVVMVGDADARIIARQAAGAGYRRLLHLAGQDHIAVHGTTAIPVYASDPKPIAPDAIRALEGQIVLLHSQRAAERFVELAERDGVARDRIEIAAISPAVLAAAGVGWRWAAASEMPSDDALVALVHARAIDREQAAADKAP
jgi:uroporphyrinogen-III synthase